MSDLVGQRVGGYPLEKLLGKSSYSVVYQAATSGAPVALRVLRDELRANNPLNQAIVKGWEDGRSVTHANLVATFSAAVDPQFGAYALQEVIRGKSLRQFILEGSKIAWRDCLILVEQLAQAIQALHAAGKVHGDIWPSNIVVTQDQDVKLEGAGGLTQLDRNPVELVAGGAAGYFPPECINGCAPYQGSDIYSLGCCVYFILGGRDPFPGEKADAVARAVLERKLAPVTVMRDDLPPEADEFIGRLLNKDTAQRYANINDVLADVQKLKSGSGLSPLKGGSPPPAPKFKPAGYEAPARLSQGGMGAVKSQSELRAVGPAPSRLSGGGMPATRSQEAKGVRKPPSGQHSATGSGFQRRIGSGMTAAVKDSGTRVYGRLETHVKSTIPQSDQEKKGDDMYRQGQLPLALTCWREAFENFTPHTGLKIKIELAEKELNLEAYKIAVEEAKLRLNTGDYKGAIHRAREGIISAETEQQRQEAVKLEERAIAANLEAERKARNTYIAVGAAGFVLLIVLIVMIKNRKPSVDDLAGDGDDVNKGATHQITNSNDAKVVIPGAAATMSRPKNWEVVPPVNNNLAELHAKLNNEVAATMKVSRLPKGILANVHDTLRTAQHDLKEQSKIDDWDALFFADGEFRCSELGFRHQTDNGPAYRYFYLISGPNNALYQVLCEGSDSLFNLQLRTQMKEMVRSWTYRKQ